MRSKEHVNGVSFNPSIFVGEGKRLIKHTCMLLHILSNTPLKPKCLTRPLR